MLATRLDHRRTTGRPRRTIRQEVSVRAARLLVLVLVSTLAACRDNPLPTAAATLPASTRARLKARQQRVASPNADLMANALRDPPHPTRR